MSRLNGSVLVLNQNYEPLNISTTNRAICLVYMRKAELIVSHEDRPYRSETLVFPRPSVVKLSRYIRVKRREIPLTKRNVLRRDNYRCQYCGTKDGTMTLDHVIPKRLGGGDAWDNLVCACSKCNNKKGDRLPDQADLTLLKRPKGPNYFAFLLNGQKLPDERWRPYLFML
jgi:5-methylcytosine-specific restriction endonuclease McrA